MKTSTLAAELKTALKKLKLAREAGSNGAQLLATGLLRSRSTLLER